MRKGFSILVLLWVFLIAPAYCLGAIGKHHCECAEINCPDCNTAPDESSHGCHDDPCPKDAYRTEQDDSVQAGGSDSQDSAVDTIAVPGSAAVPFRIIVEARAPIGSQPLCPPPLLRGADLFAFAGLPILI